MWGGKFQSWQYEYNCVSPSQTESSCFNAPSSTENIGNEPPLSINFGLSLPQQMKELQFLNGKTCLESHAYLRQEFITLNLGNIVENCSSPLFVYSNLHGNHTVLERMKKQENEHVNVHVAKTCNQTNLQNRLTLPTSGVELKPVEGRAGWG